MTMIKRILQTTVVTSALTLAATAAWAASDATTPVVGSPAGVQGPGWSGNGPGPWMMGGWGGGPMMGYGGWGGGGWMMMLFGVVILIALLALVFRALGSSARYPHNNPSHLPHGSVGLHALDERYARGEINREEYLLKKKDILGS
jgi:putative membrane protein